MTQHSRYLVTALGGEEIDLTFAKELRSNNLFPFGLHNYAIYQASEALFVKGTNSGNPNLMLDQYEVIEEDAARGYSHPHQRVEEE
ncbi:hypothetical protein [Rufibacter latericius]|uniref:Uncharacterized protein n=1 Tax=Rufibacter latericius TaxID=2487040 RepID=A0A3M9MZQ3_9BACT|nr:hypothetical protein [Rufibacter latericius]RNI31042.1 hypothetical protein EFB08_00420 [Rufibacter latericius]